MPASVQLHGQSLVNVLEDPDWHPRQEAQQQHVQKAEAAPSPQIAQGTRALMQMANGSSLSAGICI